MKEIRVHLLKGIESRIDHVKSVKELGYCYWKKANNKRLQTGDICYLFLTGKGHNQIRYRMEVVDTSCVRNDKCCWHVPYKEDVDCYKLEPTSPMYLGSGLSREKLAEIGINKYTQYCVLTQEQAEYIDKFFE